MSQRFPLLRSLLLATAAATAPHAQAAAPPSPTGDYHPNPAAADDTSWRTARDELSAQLRSNPEDLETQVAFAKLLTYRPATRDLGIERLKRLAQHSAIADRVNQALQQAAPAHPEPEPAAAAAGPQSHVELAVPMSGPRIIPAMAISPLTIPAATVAPASRVAPAKDNAIVTLIPAEPVTREYERYAQYVPQPILPPSLAGSRTLSDAAPAPGRLSLATAPSDLAAPSEPVDGPAATLTADGGGVAPFINPFRTMTAPTPDEPNVSQPSQTPPGASADPLTADPLTADIDRSIRQVSADVAPRLDTSLGVRGRSGSSGLSKLFDMEAPIEASFSPAGYGRLKVTVTPVYLTSGTPDTANRQVFGTNPLSTGVASGRSQWAGGAALDVGYAYGPFSGDIGSSPLGFLETNVVGGVQYAPRLTNTLTLRLTAERRVVTDSLLAYGGARDPLTGETWGGVTRNRGYVQLEDLIGPFGVYAGIGGAGLYGHRVQSNSEIEAGAGFSVPVWTTPTQQIRVGTNLVYFGFNRNLGNFTVGQGGYFSPQQFFAALFPVSYRDQVTPDLTYTVGGSIGGQTFRSKSEAVFPADPGLQSQLEALAAANGTTGTRFSGSHSVGVAGGARAEVDYRVHDRLHIGAKVGFDRSGNYTEGSGLVYARYVFAEPN